MPSLRIHRGHLDRGDNLVGLFNAAQMSQIKAAAVKSNNALTVPAKRKTVSKSITSDLEEISRNVEEYFKDSNAILITSKAQLHDYITELIKTGYAAIDTETTGLDRLNDTIVGSSLYYPGGVECYIPNKHIVPIFDEPYANQLTYEDVTEEYQRIADSDVRLIFANADFDLAMIYKDLKVDFIKSCYYDCITAWRCLKENEKDNSLKGLYCKYVLRGKGDPMKFRDFFTPAQFPYCRPEIAKLYAAHDAKITYELFMWQLPYLLKDNPKCKKHGFEAIADLVWNVEFPMIAICQNMHRRGIYLEKSMAKMLHAKYIPTLEKERSKLRDMVQELIDDPKYVTNTRCPFNSSVDFNECSSKHVTWIVYDLLRLGDPKHRGTDKSILSTFNVPVVNQILKCRSLVTLISTFVEKLPNATSPDSRIHCEFRAIGADCITGDSIIPTEHGYMKLRDICESANYAVASHVDITPIQIVNCNQEFESAVSVIKYENYPTIRITTTYGFVIEGTYNHPIMTSHLTMHDLAKNHSDKTYCGIWDKRKFKQLSDVKVGDIIEIPCNYSVASKYQPTYLEKHKSKSSYAEHVTLPDIYNEDFAEFLGMYHADGNSREREGTYTIALSNDDLEVQNRFTELTRSLFNLNTTIYVSKTRIHESTTYINCKSLLSLDSLLTHGAVNKKIPDAIWKSPVSVINAYIKGMTLDSSVYYDTICRNKVRFELNVIDYEDARFIQMHLASQGIVCSIVHHSHHTWGSSPRLKFGTDNYVLFAEKIGFVQSSKYLNANVSKSHRRIKNSFSVAVKKIEYSHSDVYDLHVPGTHSFISNGMISHNTGRMSSKSPNMQNIPSKHNDIRHMFRATPGYVLLSSDFSQQEPKLTAFVSQDENMIRSFQENKDIYSFIASIAFNMSYEDCLEFNPTTGAYQPEGKARRSESKSVVLGILYGRSINTIADQLYSHMDWSDEKKLKQAQYVYDSVLNAFPALRKLMINAQRCAKEKGYVETILGRRRHIPEMQLPEFEFKPLKGYVNPDIDPLDASTLDVTDDIPDRVKAALYRELKSYKYFGQVAKRIRALAEEDHIKVINNNRKIADGSRQCVNSIIQGKPNRLNCPFAVNCITHRCVA